ncbi:uncharacterized protein LJ206_016276 isoform 1-T1 [Theristicus caerulescens]
MSGDNLCEYVLCILLLILWWKSAPLNTWCQDTTICLNLTQLISAAAYTASWAGFGHIPGRCLQQCMSHRCCSFALQGHCNTNPVGLSTSPVQSKKLSLLQRGLRLTRNNQSKWFLLCLAAHSDGLPRGERVVRRNLVLRCCLTFNLLQRLTRSSTQLQALRHRFSSCKGPSSETITILAAVKLIGCPGAKVKLKYVSKCLQDQDFIQA